MLEEVKYYNEIMKNNFREELVMTKENEKHRSSCSQMLFKIGFVKIFAIFTGKHMCWRPHHKYFTVNIGKFLRIVFL